MKNVGIWQARTYMDTAVEIIDAAEERADGYSSWGRALTADEMGDIYEALMLAKAELNKLEKIVEAHPISGEPRP